MVLKHPYTNRYTYSNNKWDLDTLLLIMQMVDVSFVKSHVFEHNKHELDIHRCICMCICTSWLTQSESMEVCVQDESKTRHERLPWKV